MHEILRTALNQENSPLGIIPSARKGCRALKRNRLQKLPSGLLRYSSFLEELYISNNRLENVPEDLLRNTSNLTRLDISENQLRSLPKTLLQNTCNLKVLLLQKNKLTHIEESFFHQLKNLHTLDLGDNLLSDMDVSVLSSLKMMFLLSIENNGIRAPSTDFVQDMTNLYALYMAGNKISNFRGDSFRQVRCLGTLDLTDNNMTIQSLSDLSMLYCMDVLMLSGNKIEEIPDDSFQNLTFVRMLELNNIGLRDIPDFLLSPMEELDYLKMEKNQLVEIRKTFFANLTVLTLLSLNWNRIQYIEKGSFSLPSLEQLFIAYNRLTEIPQAVQIPLYILDLSGNMIQKVYERSFTDVGQYKILFISYNEIKSIEDNAFSHVGECKIFLFGNKLSVMSNSSFNNLKIPEIHLYGNNISTFDDKAFLGINNTTRVYLDCNQVHVLRQPNVKIECVTPIFVPHLQVIREAAKVIEGYGFECTDRIGQKSLCSPCPRGTFGNGRNKCTSCPRGGFYQDEVGRVQNDRKVVCKRCKNGTFVISGGGISEDACMVCPEGTNKAIHAGHRACFCLDHYARKDRFGPCYLCQEEGINCSGKDYKSLRAGYYWSWNFKGANFSQYKQFTENLDTKNGFFGAYTQYEGEIPRTFRCPRHQSCINSKENEEVVCSEGYKGWLCSKCDEKFYSVINNCLPCPDTEWLFIEISLVLSFGAIIIASYIYFVKRNKGRKKNGRSFIYILMSRTKIALGFYQVVGEFLTSFNDVYWTQTLRFIGDFISIIKLNILRLIIKPQCFYKNFKIDPKIEFIIVLAFPVLLILISIMCYQIMINRYKCKARVNVHAHAVSNYAKPLKYNIWTIVVVMMFLTYPPTCTIIFQLYPKACVTFCLDIKNSTCKNLLRSDYDIECQTLKIYNAFAYVATAGYIFAYPMLLFYFLTKKSALLVSQNTSSLALSNNEHQLEELQQLADDSPCNKSYPAWMDFFCESYKAQYWYWEFIELSRKVTQTVLITLLGWENKLTVLLTICISVLFLTLHAGCMPMKNQFEQRLQQLFSLVAILVNVLVAAMNFSEEYGEVISVVLIILNLAVIAIIAGEIVFSLFSQLKRSKVPLMLKGCGRRYHTMFMNVLRRRVSTEK
ncbi:Insulin-like growth factor-binding protein complex acid labile subunit [Holothuria leucospilota]|uniref:Insulin-like growth factor-binding protein complex acid labile subunit n=1 Tax=Holothuria leucospilota TaxID=206669 RepID=A0A9Q1HKR3_HOLLE|nr:Insulin-like growth factor-binding protein complex acid labile subunit [Holothuria leucospilota]